jgi:hypothetical protein
LFLLVSFAYILLHALPTFLINNPQSEFYKAKGIAACLQQKLLVCSGFIIPKNFGTVYSLAMMIEGLGDVYFSPFI